MKENKMHLSLIFFATSVALWSPMGLAAQSQIPPAIKEQIMELSDRFSTTLEQECPQNRCFPIGCKVGRYEVLDQVETSSLPGLDEDAPAKKPGYKLSSVVCEFTYETDMEDGVLQKLRQRVRQKTKPSGIELQLLSRPLDPKPSMESKVHADEVSKSIPPPTLLEKLLITLIPYSPWLLIILIITVCALFMIWGLRRLGKSPLIIEKLSSNPSVSQDPVVKDPLTDPTLPMVIARQEALKTTFTQNEDLAARVIKKLIEEKNWVDTCYFIKYFGPLMLNPLKAQIEYQEALEKISDMYSSFTFDESTTQTWKNLDQFEKHLTSVQVTFDPTSNSSAFKFLEEVSPHEIIGLLAELSEKEMLAVLSNSPSRLRESFFKLGDSKVTMKLLELLSKTDKLPDTLVQSTAQKVKGLYDDKASEYRVVPLNRVPIVEEAFNALTHKERHSLVGQLKTSAPEFMSLIADQVFLDEGLLLFSESILTDLFLNIAPDEAAAYLKSLPFGTKLLSRINPKVASSISAKLKQELSLNPHKQEAARTKIERLIKNLHAQQKINLGVINAEVLSKVD